MNIEDEKEIAALMRAARDKARGYADYFGWAIDRDLEEVGVVRALAESMDAKNEVLFTDILGRGRPNDPPDVEALSLDGKRIAIEVTELVDGEAIVAFKNGREYDWADWSKEKFITSIERLLNAKDSRFPKLKDPPYEGGYIVLIFTDEPVINSELVNGYLKHHLFKKVEFIYKSFLVLSYDPSIKGCPYFELKFNN